MTGSREQFATRLVFLAVGFAIAAWAPLVPFAKARLAIDEGELGLLLLCLGGGSILAMPATGVLATRYGCRLVLAGGIFVFSAALPLLALAPNFATMAIALIFFGGAIGTVDVTINIQAIIVEKDSRRSMMSGFHGLYSLGGMLGAGGVSALLLLGASPLIAAFCYSVSGLVALALAFRGLLPYGNIDGQSSPPFVLPRGFVTFIGMLCFLVFLAEGAVLDWSAVYLVSELGFDPAAAGYGYALFAVAMTLGRLFGDSIVSRLGGVRIMVFGGLLAAAGFALPLLIPSQAAALIGFLLVGLGASNTVPVLFTAAGRQTEMPPSLAVAAVTTLGYAGILVGPALIGFIAQGSSIGFAFALIALSMLFVALSGRAVRR